MSESTTHFETVYTSKPDIAANAIYPTLARATLFELHANLLELLEKRLSEREGPKNLVVVGPGSEALPFSENKETLAALLNGGNLILLDYNQEICDSIPAYLENQGFDRLFTIKRADDETFIDPEGFQNTLWIKSWDLRNGFPLTESSIDAIDMTVSMHHVTMYTSDISNLFMQARKALKTKGLLHLGEGDVDMKYSERKLKKMALDVLAAGARGVGVWDGRYADSMPRQWCIGEEETDASMRVTANGMIRIDHTDIEAILSYFEQAGYKQKHVDGNTLVLPLIDHSMDDDFHGMIVPVRAYYHAIAELCRERLDPAYHEASVKALNKERSDAVRGIVEYYSLPSLLCGELAKTGFEIGEMRQTVNGPFVNILAINT